MKPFPTSDRVDIMLLLEGTFPYVSGGVSSWVNQILLGFPEYRFGAVFLGSSPDDYGEMQYQLPQNLVHLETFYLHDRHERPMIEPLAGDSHAFESIRQLHAWFRRPDAVTLPKELTSVDFYQSSSSGVDFKQFLHSAESWQFITDLYEQRCSDPSFVDYFWTIRNMHAPVWLLAELAARLIPAGMYHAVSTGYAGFLGSLLSFSTGRPLLLTEHGIYTKERRIDIFHSEWIRDNRNALQKDPTEVSYFRNLWIRFFEVLGRFSYEAADNIVSLYAGARQRQIDDGAPADRTRVIPNGIDLRKYASLRDSRHERPPAVLTLIGRVVPIKDIKTFIRALRIIAGHIPDVQGWIVGPEDQDPEYAAECHALVESLAIGNRVRFMGFRNPLDVLPDTGLMVLSSVSEGLPLVVLEAFAAGVPVVATDVGACRQLITGHGEEDEALGAAGSVVAINNPRALAEEAVRLLSDAELWRMARQAAIARVERFYTQKKMFDDYRTLYTRELGRWQE